MTRDLKEFLEERKAKLESQIACLQGRRLRQWEVWELCGLKARLAELECLRVYLETL